MTTKLSTSPVTRETALKDGRDRDILVTLHEDGTLSLRSKRCKEDWCRIPLEQLLPWNQEPTQSEPDTISLVIRRLQAKIQINPDLDTETKQLFDKRLEELKDDFLEEIELAED